MEESHFQSSANSGSDAEEEKYSHDQINTSDKNAEFSGANNLEDDEFLMEFKNKYQQSLEAIQSFQEILELKKNFPNLKHSYNPPRRKERTELPSLKASNKLLQSKSPQKPEFEPLFQLNFSKVQRLPQLEQSPSPLELFSQTERANRRNFRIKDVHTKTSAELASFFKTPRLSQTGFFTERTGISKDLKEELPIQSAFSLNLNSAKSVNSPGILPSPSTFSARKLEAPQSGSKITVRLPRIETPLEQTENFDQVMGEPYAKIKIKNLKNYKAEPLEVYDQALMHHDEDPQELLNSGINRGFSKFLNPKGEIEWKDCEILSYLEDEKKFLIRWRHDGNTKKVTRLNLRYAVESEYLFEERIKKTTENRYKNLYMGSYKEMIQQKARQDPWMNYPMKSFNKIVQLSFQKFDHSEESETVVILVDQLMDHYKEEITKFSMEINSFKSDFSTFMKKFKDAYHLLKNTTVKNQDKAIEIVNMPYKEYREYKDWADDVIIDAEEMDTAKLRVFNDPSSHTVFYQSITKYSKLRMNQSAEFLIQVCEALTFQNFLTLNETGGRPKATILTYQRKQSLAMKEENWHLLREDTTITEEINPKDYLDRAILTRKTRLVDMKKLKVENKFLKKLPPDTSNMSSVIQAFQQTITQILPKPLEFTSKFFVMVSALMRQLSEIRIFRALKPFRKSNITSSLDKLKTLSDEFNTDSNKIDLYIYRVQQCVDELKVDIKILKNETLEKDTLKRVCDFSTTMAHDATKICIKESLESLMEDLEEYYALLPLPVVSYDILEKLPKHILNKREKYRRDLYLKSDHDILKADPLSKPQQLSDASSQGVANTDKELIREIILFIMNDLLNVGNLYKEGFIQSDLLRIKPLFLIKYTIKEKQKSIQKTKIKMTRQDRARQRLTSRENIFQFEEFKDRLLSDHSRNEEMPEVTIKIGNETKVIYHPEKIINQNLKERFVGKDAFSWFKLGRAEITHEPHIYDIEQKLKKILMSAFDIFPKLERVDTAPPPNDNFMTIDGLEDDLMSCRFRLDELFRISLLPLFALFSILRNFEFLLTQDKHYTSDIKDSFNDSDDKNIATICYEIEQLQNDLDFLSTKIPTAFHIGFFMLDISEYTTKLKKNIEKYLNNLKEFLEFKLEEIITSNRAVVAKIEDRLSKGALTIDHYIELKIFLESEELKSDFENIRESIDISQLIVNYMEDFNILYNPDILDIFYMSKGWIQTLNKAKMDAQVQLEAARPRLINELKQKNEQIFKELEGIKIDISNYANHYDLANAQNYFHNARDIMLRLDELMEYGIKCNFYEEMLFARKTDWSGIEGIKENFDKFYLLWEFIYDKWMIKSDYWLNLHFENLDVQDMEDIIQEGLKLLNLLEEKFKNNINILDLVRSYLREVSRYKDYLDLLKKLKSETFKPRHWDLLWSEMYSSLATKPDPKLITLKKLLEDKLFTYASLINTIYKNAQEEYNIEQEIERIEEGIMKIKDLNAHPYDVGKGNDVFILKGIGPVISKLQDFHFAIKNMLSNSNYPRAFLDRLTSLDSIIKGVKKLMKLARRIQKKVFIIAPIMRHRFILQFFGKDKDHEPAFNQIHTQYKQQVEAIIKGKKMHYLVALFDRMTLSEMPEKKKEATGEDLIENFIKIDAKCDVIVSDLYLVIRQLRSSCPRLHLLTDYHIIEYMSVAAEPKEVIRDLSWLFSNVKELKIDSSGKSPLAIYGLINTLHETLTFANRIPINPQDQDGSNFYIPALLNEIEKELKQSVRNNLIKFMPVFFENAYNFANNFKLFKEKNVIFQNLILLTNILFYHDMTMIIGSKQYVSENAKESFIANKLKLFKSNIEHNLATLCELFRYERDRFWFLLLNQYIFHIKYQLEIVNYVIESDVQSLDAFEFLIIPKTMLEYQAKAVKNSDLLTSTVNASKSFLETTTSIQDFNLLNTKSDFLHSAKNVDPANYNIIIKSFYYKRNYGFSLLPFTEPIAFAPSTNRCYVTMLGALATQSGVIVHGLQDQGKKETIKSLAYLVGKETFIVDQYATDYNCLTQVIFGTPKGGFWVIFDNLQDYSSAVLSTMAQQIQMIRNTLANGDFRVKYGSSSFDLRGDQNWAFFATYSSKQTGELRSLSTVPKNFSENFRILNFINPHLSQIILLYYDLYGVQYPQETANRTLTFLQVLSNAAENQHFFSSDKITLQEIEYVQALNIKPSMNLITKIMKNLQTMIISQTVLKIGPLEIWKAIRKSLAPFTQETTFKIILNLFNAVFQSDITNVTEQEEELEVDFKEMLEKYKKEHNIPNTNKFDSKCSELFTILNTLTSQYKTVLINGKVGSGKTLVLEATASILADVKTTNFCLNWIDLDSTPSTLVLGGEYKNIRVQGLLPIFIEVAVNEMKSSEIQEYQYADLVRHCSHWAQHPSPQSALVQSRLYDWIIFEGIYDQMNVDTVNVIDRLIAGKKQGMITALDGYKIRIPKTMNVVIECDKMTALNPANLADVMLISINNNIFTIEQQFDKKIGVLAKFGDYFLHHHSLLKNIFKEIIEPVINHAEQEYSRQGLIYYLSETHLLTNFLSIFEIFLNECRKIEISFGNITEDEIERAEEYADANPIRKAPSGNFEEKKSSVAVSKGDIMGIRHSMRLDISHNAAHTTDRQSLMIESSCIFCLIWTIGILYKPEYRSSFSKQLITTVKNYYKDNHQELLDSFPFIFFLKFFGQKPNSITSTNLGIFDYCFDLQTQRWTPWNEILLPEYQEISSEFIGVRLPAQELLKFNPALKKSGHSRAFMQTDFNKRTLPLVKDELFVQTETSKKLLFFLDYFIAYKKPVIVLSEYQNGKTSAINNKLKLMLENNASKTFSFALTPLMTKEKLSQDIQNSLIRNSRGSYSPSLDLDGLIFIDDLNLSSIEEKPWSLIKSFSNHKGWYDINKNSFIKLDRTSFIAALSYSFLNQQQQQQSDNTLPPNIPQEFLQKMLLHYMPEMTTRDMKSIFKEFSEPIVSQAEGKPYLKTLKSFINQFLVFNYRHKDRLQTLSNLFGCNLTTTTALQMFKKLEFWNWDEESNQQNFLDLWFLSLKMIYGNQFEKSKPLPDEFIIEIEMSLKSVPASNNTSMNQINSQNIFINTQDENVAKSSIFDDPLKHQRSVRRQRKKTLTENENKDSDESEVTEKRIRRNQRVRTLGQIGEFNVDSHALLLSKDIKIHTLFNLDQKMSNNTSSVPTITNQLFEMTSPPEQKSNDESKTNLEDSINTQTPPIISLPIVQTRIKRSSFYHQQEQQNERKPSIEEVEKPESRGSVDRNLLAPKDEDLLQPSLLDVADDVSPQEKPTLRKSIYAKRKVSFTVATPSEEAQPEPTISIPSETHTLQPKKTTEKTRVSQFSSYSHQRINAPSESKHQRSSFSRNSLENEIPDVDDDNKSESDDSVSSVASSDSDERVNLLEKEFDIYENQHLANLPTDCFNLLSQILIFSKNTSKITEEVARDRAFLFNTNILITEKEEIDFNNSKPVFELIHLRDQDKKDDILNYIQSEMVQHLADNKNGILFFNNFTFRLSSVLPHISSLLLELQTPSQSLFLTSRSQPLYCYHAVKFCSHILAYRIATLHLTPKKVSNTDIHNQFLTLFYDTLTISALEGRKCIFTMIVDTFKPGRVDISKDFLNKILQIFQDLNTIILGGSLKTILSRQQVKTLFSILKKDPTYAQYSEAHLFFVARQLVKNNIKFIIVAEDEALKINNLTFKFHKTPDQLTLIELFLKYFPQMYLQFRKIILDDLQLLVDKRVVLDEDIFPLNLDEKLCLIFQNSFNYEIQFGSLQDNTYGYSILPNFRIAILMADFVFSELKNNLNSKSEAQKGTGHNLIGAIRKLKKRGELLEVEIKDLRRFIQDREHEITGVHQNTVNLKLKKEQLGKEIEDINKQLMVFEEDLKGFGNEENILKKLQLAFSEATNAILLYDSKLYMSDIKYAGFFTSKFFIVYAILWCQIFSMGSVEDKYASSLDLSIINTGPFSTETVQDYINKFYNLLNNFNEMKDRILKFKFSQISTDELTTMITILKDNNLITSNMHFNKLQKSIMKWTDLVVEICKFELRRDFRLKEVFSIKTSSEELRVDLSARNKIFHHLELALEEQPRLLSQVNERIDYALQNISGLETTISRMTNLAQDIETIIKANFELNNPCAANKVLYAEYIRAAALYMTQCSKYSAQVRPNIFKLILNNMNSELDFNAHRLHSILQGEGFLVDCLTKKIPMSLNFIDNISVFEMSFELNLQYPLVIDPSGLFLKYLQKKFAQKLILEQNMPSGATIANVSAAMEKGNTIVLVDFNKDLLNVVEPLLNWRYTQIISKLYNKHYYADQNQEKKTDGQESDDEVHIVNQPNDQFEFNGVKCKVHPDFKLILLLQNKSFHISKFILEKVFIINNDISGEETWTETVSDLILTTCYATQREAAVIKYYNERSFSEANEQFKVFIEQIKKVDLLAPIENSVLEHLGNLAESVKRKYKIHTTPQQTTSSPRRSQIALSPNLKKSDARLLIPLSEQEKTEENSESQDEPPKLRERSFSFLKRNKGETTLFKKGSVRSSFFIHSQSVAGSNISPTSSPSPKKDALKSRFFEGNQVQEFSSLWSNFPDLETVLLKHSKLIQELYLLKTTAQLMNSPLGNIYSLSEQNILFNIQQALEITLLNGYLKSKATSTDIEKFEAMTVFNTFQQLYSTFRKDHQNIFSFYFSILLLKSTQDFNESIWRFILYRKIGSSAVQKALLDPNTTHDWQDVSTFLSGFFELNDNKIPPLIPFNPQAAIIANFRKLLPSLAHEDSILKRFLIESAEAKTISLEVPGTRKAMPLTPKQTPIAANSYIKSLLQNKPKEKEQSTPTKLTSPTGLANKINLIQLNQNEMPDLDLPKIALPKDSPTKTSPGRTIPTSSFHSNMTDILSNKLQKSANFLVRNKHGAPIELGGSPMIPKQAYQFSFSETVQKHETESPIANSPSQTKKSLFAKASEEKQSQASDDENDFSGSKKLSLIKRDRKILNASGEPNIVEDEVLLDNQALDSLKTILPQIHGLFADMEKDVNKWTEFLNKSIFNYKQHNSIFPQMPNNWNKQFGSLEMIALIKCLRPDALEMFVRGFLGETRHYSYFLMPKTNFESHARTNWFQRPTLVLFGDDSRNPVEHIELLALRNKNQCFKVALGATPIEIVIEEFTRCCSIGKWFVLENFHLLADHHLPAFIKRINLELTKETTLASFKLWITYYQKDSAYGTSHLSNTKTSLLEQFFRSCFKIYFNISNSVKARLFELYKGNFQDFYTQLETDAETSQIKQNTALATNKPQASLQQKKNKQHRLRLQTSEEKIDMYAIFQPSSQTILKDNPPQQEPEETNQTQDLCAKVKFMTTFLFAIITERLKFEKPLQDKYSKNSISFVTDNDLTDLLDDILNFAEKNSINPFNLVEKFFCFMFDYQTPTFMTFNNLNICYLFRTFVSNNPNFRPIQIKTTSYNMPQGQNLSDLEIFQCIRSLPNEDPIQLFGYNTNHEMAYSYGHSQKMTDFLVKCNNQNNRNNAIQVECHELENLILNQKQEQELEVILEEYSTLKSDKTLIQNEDALRLASLLKKLNAFIPPCFDFRTIGYFEIYQSQPFGLQKNSQLKLENRLAPSIPVPRSFADTSSNQSISLAIPNSGRKRRPSAGNRDKFLNEAIKSSFVEKFKKSPEASRKIRKYSFTIVDSPKVTPGRTVRPKHSPAVSSNLDYDSGSQLGETPSDNPMSRIARSLERSRQPSIEKPSDPRNEFELYYALFKNLMLHEIKLCNNILRKIKQDLLHCLKIIQGSEHVASSQHNLVHALLENQIPKDWYDANAQGLPHSATLISFLRVLDLKYENLKTLVKELECVVPPSIPLGKLFDPLFFFTGIIWTYSQHYKIPFNECQLVLQRNKTRPTTQQNSCGVIFISGLKINGGRVDERIDVLEDEFSKEFSSSLDQLTIKVTQKPKSSSDTDSSIPIIFKSKTHARKKNEPEPNIVNDYNEYIKKYSANKVEKSARPTKSVQYPVRIPLVDPCLRQLNTLFPLEFFFYVKSTKPQEYWQMKGTHLSFEIGK